MVAGYTSLRVIEAIHDNDFSIQILPHIALALIITERLEARTTKTQYTYRTSLIEYLYM